MTVNELIEKLKSFAETHNLGDADVEVRNCAGDVMLLDPDEIVIYENKYTINVRLG